MAVDVDEYAKNFAKILEELERGFDVIVRDCGSGDFGRLVDIDFSNGNIMGHVDFWSSGMIFFGLMDSSRENPVIIEETNIYADGLTFDDVCGKLNIIIKYITESD